MEREIKFRAWDERHSEMRYSDKHDGEFYINLKGVLYMYAIPMSEAGLEKRYYKSYNVMQFTGLKDSKGVDIYEGDIVENMNLDKRQIMYCDRGFEMRLLNGNLDSDNTTWWYAVEIIGNVHENPELCHS